MTKIHKNNPNSKLRKGYFLRTLVGVVLIFASTLYGIQVRSICNKLLENYLILRPDSRIFDMWSNPPIHPTLYIYFFNWTNPHEFEQPNIKPRVEELGPYRFNVTVRKTHIQWHPQNHTVSFQMQKVFHFDDYNSNGSLSDEIMLFNFMSIGAAIKAKHLNFFQRAMIEMGLSVTGQGYQLKRTAREFLFDGYDEPLLSIGNMVPSALSGVESVNVDKVGIGYGQNVSYLYAPPVNMHTGADDVRQAGRIHTVYYNNYTSSKFPKECNAVNGYYGDLFPQHLKPDDKLDIYIREFCRHLNFEYHNISNVNGKQSYYYRTASRLMDNGTQYPENKCFCNGECVPSGVMNISSCWFNAPLFISYPHFLDADQTYVDGVESMRPQRALHESSLQLEPQTGLMLRLNAKFQVNVYVQKVSHSKLYRNVRNVMFPLFWFHFDAGITPDLMYEFTIFEMVILAGHTLASLGFTMGLLVTFWPSLKQKLCKTSTDSSMTAKNIAAKDSNLQHAILEGEPLLIGSTKLTLAYSPSLDSGHSTDHAHENLQDSLP